MTEQLKVVILTFNEEKNLPKCLESLKGLPCSIYIIDSFSTDLTESIAKSYGAAFIQNKFETHVKQWQFGLNSISGNSGWILGLDADQEITPELKSELMDLLENDHKEIAGYYLCRRNYFLGEWIKYGGYYPRFLLKLFRQESVYLDEAELMDHHFYVNGKTGKLKHDIIENNLKEDLFFWKEKHKKYAQLQAKEEFEKLTENKGNLFGNQDQRRLFFKYIWNNMPLFVRPVIYFLFRFIIQGGFRDGKIGRKFHYLQAYWYRSLVDKNILQLKMKRWK